MRAGGCTVQQALTAEAAGMVKEAVSLARRRGNAQVTPLHVASAMLASPSGLLRAACLRSHSHPLQCKALELCFNVALNRLPASAAVSPLLSHAHHGHHYYPPSLSNALVAAFKRAQAHQRRGSVESQQQPVLAVKIELEQLVISILDDPSVSRVMREAGFSSTQVKANVEQAVSSSVDGNHCSTTTATISQNPNPNPTAITTTPPVQETKPKLPLDPVKEEDVTTILDCLAGKSKRRIMVVAECATTTEAAVRAAVEKIKRGEARHEALRSVQLVNLTVSRFWDLPREEADRRLAELRCLVRSMRGAVLLVVEDLRWAAEFWARHVEKGRRSYYCAVEHAITEVRALACGGGDGPWLVGFGTYETYMRYCRAGHPSLETMWGLQTLAVPTGSLALSLSCVDDSALAVNHQSMKARCDDSGNGPSSCWLVLDSGGSCSRRAIPGCCGDCAAAKSMPRSSSLPSWLRHGHDQEPAHLSDLCKKWSSICSPPCHWMTLNLSSVVSPSTSVQSYEHGHLHHQPYHPWLLADLEAKQPWKAKSGEADDAVRHGAKVDSKSHDSGASNGTVEVECRSRFKELTAENLKLLCGALEKEVPWQKEVIPKIVSTVLRCRSGMAKRHDNSRSAEVEEETWLLFLGGDTDGKVRVAKELARLVFGSHSNFLSIGLNASTSSRFDSSEERRSKLSRPKASQGYLDRLYEAVRDKPHQVILMEDIEHASRHCQVGIKEAIESGVVRSHDGDEVGLGDAIVVLSCESIDARSRVCLPPPTKRMKAERDQELEEKENAASDHREAEVNSSSPACFDLNLGVEKEAEECCLSDVGLLEAVDRTLFFRIPEEGL